MKARTKPAAREGPAETGGAVRAYDGAMPPARQSRVLGWWYISIGCGFIVLGVNRLVQGDRSWLSALRWLIAAGFFLLASFELWRKEK